METFHLSLWDYIIFGIVLGISAFIGVYFRMTGGYQRTMREYLLANNEMSALPVAFSLMASFISAITLLGVSSEIYNYGTQFLVINFAYVLGTYIVCYVYLPVFRNLGVVSVYEYLEMRFGKTTRTIASTAFLIQMVLYMGIVVYAPSIALSSVTGLDKNLCILSIGIVCTFYSTIGGMKAVLFTDVFQSLLMITAILSVIYHGIIEFGGFGQIWQIAVEGERIEFFNLDPTVRHTFFSQLIGGTFVFLSLYGVNQAQVQRLLSTRNLQTARLSLWYSLPILMTLSFATGFAGLVIYAKYRECDPLLSKRITSSDQLLPLYVVESFKPIPGLAGLFIAGILSGSLSTVSSAINSLAAVTYRDFFHSILQPKHLGTAMVSCIIKTTALGYGIICIAVAFTADYLTGVLQASLTIFGVVGGPVLGLFSLGLMFPKNFNEVAVVLSFIISLGFTSWMGFGFGYPKPIPAKLYLGDMCDSFNITVVESMNVTSPEPTEYFYLHRISYQYYPYFGCISTVVIALLLSVIFKSTKTNVDPILLAPSVVRYLVDENFQMQID